MRLLFIIILFLFNNLSAQDLRHFDSPISGALQADKMSLIDVQQVDDRLRVITLCIYTAKSARKALGFSASAASDESYPISVVDVAYQDPSNGKIIDKKRHILHSPTFKGGKYRIEVKGTHLGDEDIVVKYDELVKMYPDVSFGAIDKYNRDLPESYYSSRLKMNLVSRINGFTSSRYTKTNNQEKAAPEKKKKKGLMRKFTDMAVKQSGIQTYNEESIADLDWKDTFNGKSDKKNHWLSMGSYGCSETGKVVVITSHKTKEDKLSYEKDYELLSFDAKGDEIDRKDLSFDVPRKWEYLSGIYGKGAKLNAVMGLVVDIPRKKVNPEHNRKRVSTYFYDVNDANIITNDIELPFNYSQVDTVFNIDNNTLAIGIEEGSSSGDAYAVLVLSKEKSKMFLIKDENKKANYKFTSLQYENGSGYFAFVDSEAGTKEAKGLVLPIVNDEQMEPLHYSFEDDSKNVLSGSELVKSGDDTYLLLKNVVKGRKGEVTMIQVLSVSNDDLATIVDESTFIALEPSQAVSYSHDFKKHGGKTYWLSRLNTKKGYVARLVEM